MSERVCVVAGVGPGNGEALTRHFAEKGYRVAMLARSEDYLRGMESEIDGARGYVCDLTDPASVSRTFERAAAELGPVDVLIHNAGAFLMKPFVETTPAEFEQQWRVNAWSTFLVGQAVVPAMVERGSGTFVIIGATASLRGGANFAAFAPSKAAQRILAESLARQLGPKGVHVAYVVIDGVVDRPQTRQWMSGKPDDFFLKPADIAQSVGHLVDQPRSAWTFQLDVRPFGESW